MKAIRMPPLHGAWMALLMGLLLSACGTTAEEPAAQTPKLSDAQIIGVMQAINRAEIRQAELAMARSADPQVLMTAEQLANEHREMSMRLARLAEGLGARPQPSDLSRKLEQMVQQATDRLRELSGAEFNRGYLQTQVLLHQTALDVVQQELIPAARSENLKRMLQVAAPHLHHHLQQAKMAQDSLRG